MRQPPEPQPMDAESLVRRAHAAAVATDADDRIHAWNSAASQLLGHDASTVEGSTFSELLEPRDVFGNRVGALQPVFLDSITRGELIRSFEINLQTSGRKVVRVAVSVVVILNGHDDQTRFVYLMTPLQHRRRADEVIERLLTNPHGTAELIEKLTAGDAQQPPPRLTARQREILELMAAGHTAKAMATSLGISVHTVRNHVQAVLVAFGASSQLEAVTRALAAGVLTSPSSVGSRRG